MLFRHLYIVTISQFRTASSFGQIKRFHQKLTNIYPIDDVFCYRTGTAVPVKNINGIFCSTIAPSVQHWYGSNLDQHRKALRKDFFKIVFWYRCLILLYVTALQRSIKSQQHLQVNVFLLKHIFYMSFKIVCSTIL